MKDSAMPANLAESLVATVELAADAPRSVDAAKVPLIRIDAQKIRDDRIIVALQTPFKPTAHLNNFFTIAPLNRLGSALGVENGSTDEAYRQASICDLPL
jgi:hypothetical protein